MLKRDARAADRALRATVAAARRARVPAARVAVGDKGWLLRPRGDRPLVLLWRRRDALGAILLRAPLNGRRFALAYARVADARMARDRTATPWQRALEGIRPNGTVPRATALKLFALAYRPLPGATRPRGSTGAPEGSLAGNLALRLWPKLSRTQRRAVLRGLGLAGVETRRRRKAAVEPDSPAAPTTYGDPGFVEVPQYKAWAEAYVPTYAGKLNHQLSLKLVVGRSTTATVDDSFRVTKDGIASAAGEFCRTRITPKTIAKGATFVKFVLAHELFHCFQLSIESPFGGGPWVFEGTAEWAALKITQAPWEANGQLLAGEHFENYFVTCADKSLFERDYDALGFFGHGEETTGDLWPKLVGILKANQAGSYNLAGGNQDVMLDSWGSSVVNMPTKLGAAWATKDPVTPPDYVTCSTGPPISEGSVDVAAYRVRPYQLVASGDPNRPLLEVKMTGHARIGDGVVDRTDLADAWFCLREKCECPEDKEGNPPPAAPLKPDAYLALTGGTSGAQGTLKLHSLDEYCKKKEKKPPPPPPGPPIGGGGGGGGGCTGGCGGSNGDPHLTTFDGFFYDFQGAGEYTLAKSKADSLEVQAREEPYPGSTTLAINTAVAMRVGRNRVVVERGDPLVVRLNGLGLVPRRRPAALPGGGSIRSQGGQVEVRWPDGTLARVWSVSSWGVAVLVKPVLARRGTLTGLLGNFDGDQKNDFATRRGARLDRDRTLGSRRRLYGVFGESWRIRQRTSLFDYARGQTTRRFTIRSFPRTIMKAEDLLPAERRRAAAICRRLGITNPRILEGCILDVAGTDDGRFATAGATLERTGRKFGAPPAAGEADTRWASLGVGGRSNILTPSLAYEGGKVVVVYDLDARSAQVVTFTPSATADAVGLKRVTISSGWGFLNHPVVLPRAGGGLQVLLAGTRGSTFATWFTQRNPDGSFGPLALATTSSSDSTGGHGAVLAPDGQPLWVQASAGGLRVLKGAANAALSDLGTALHLVDVIQPQIGRDAMGRYWIAFYSLGRRDGPQSGLYMLRLDPVTLKAIGPVRRAPGSGTISNDHTTLVCGPVCRVAYQQVTPKRTTIVTWASGERRATTVARKVYASPWLTAAYGPDGRLWIAWWDAADNTYRAVRGNAAGAGGTPAKIGRPFTTGGGYLTGSIVTPAGFVLVTNWALRETFVRFVNVVAPG
jgi:hypothetical protein